LKKNTSPWRRDSIIKHNNLTKINKDSIIPIKMISKRYFTLLDTEKYFISHEKQNGWKNLGNFEKIKERKSALPNSKTYYNVKTQRYMFHNKDTCSH
jgi:hypothetical protein